MLQLKRFHVVLGIWAAVLGNQAVAWGPDGHHTVGAIADQLIAGSNAAKQVHTILGGLSLQDAAVWADCAKGIDPNKNFTYTSAGVYPECKIYETPALEAEMADFVRRNDTNCARKPAEESCHKQYHYTDVAIQRSQYALGKAGTRDDDIVAAVAAVTHVLKGESTPAPFNIKSKREALLLLAHYVGDIHQPLHVGAVYLDAKGNRVDPDAGSLDPATETRGGNQIIIVNAATQKKGANLHHTWDDIPASMTASHVNAAWLTQARAVPLTSGPVVDWSQAWGTDTLGQAQLAFQGLSFGPLHGADWSVSLPATYNSTMSTIKKQQLTKGGARLAQLLQALWP
jgi:hypothetical protein